jgi:tetratricopeptide (TPR) repeat protein
MTRNTRRKKSQKGTLSKLTFWLTISFGIAAIIISGAAIAITILSSQWTVKKLEEFAKRDPAFGIYPGNLDKIRGWRLRKLVHRGMKAYDNYSYEEAMGYFTEAKDITTDVVNKLALRNLIGLSYYYVGELEAARETLDKTVLLAESVGDRNALAILFGNEGVVYNKLGQPDKALEFHRKAWEIDKQIGNLEGQARHLSNMSVAHLVLTKPDSALMCLERALAIHERVDYPEGQARDLGRMGLAYLDLGEPDTALQYFKRSLDVSKEIGYLEGQAASQGNMGNLYYECGDPYTALGYFKGAFDIYEQIGDYKGQAQSLQGIANVYYEFNEPDMTLKYLKDAARIYEHIGYFEDQAECYIMMGNIYYQLNHPDSAGIYLTLAQEVIGFQGDSEYKIEDTQETIGVSESSTELDIDENDKGDEILTQRDTSDTMPLLFFPEDPFFLGESFFRQLEQLEANRLFLQLNDHLQSEQFQYALEDLQDLREVIFASEDEIGKESVLEIIELEIQALYYVIEDIEGCRTYFQEIRIQYEHIFNYIGVKRCDCILHDLDKIEKDEAYWYYSYSRVYYIFGYPETALIYINRAHALYKERNSQRWVEECDRVNALILEKLTKNEENNLQP